MTHSVLLEFGWIRFVVSPVGCIDIQHLVPVSMHALMGLECVMGSGHLPFSLGKNVVLMAPGLSSRQFALKHIGQAACNKSLNLMSLCHGNRSQSWMQR